MSFRKYGAYKDVEIPWACSLPADWGVARAKNLFKKMSRPPRSDDEIVTCFRDGVVTLRKNRRSEGFTEALQEIGYQRVCAGDLVIHAMDAFAGAIGVSDSDGKSSPVYVVCTPKTRLNPHYYAHVVREMALNRFVLSLAKGIRERSTDFRYETFASQILPVPPFEVQNDIVLFIDQQTAKIDALVAEQDHLIGLLNEKRQAVIDQAVTNGLDPNVSMKDSGLGWLGQVPQHWKIRRVKSVSSFITSGPRGWSDHVGEEGHLFIQSGDLNDRLRVEFATAKRVQVADDAEANRTRLHDGDIVVCITGAKTGNVAICASVPEPAYVNQHLCLIRPTREVLPAFMALLLKSRVGKTHFELSQYGLKQGLSLEDVRDAPILLAPAEEQEAIVADLKAQASKFEVLTAEAERAIALLKERRSALISAAVTGKIDVRGLTPAVQEAA